MRVNDLMSGLMQDSDFEEIIGVGEWWLPTHEEIRIPGEFRFNINGVSQLIVIGRFGDEQYQEFENLDFPIMCGRTDAGSCVTLFDCKVKDIISYCGKMSHIRRTIVFGDCWIGNVSFISKESVCLDKISFGINNLNWWVADTIFSYDIQDHGFSTISFAVGEEIVLLDDDRIHVAIMHCPVIQAINPGETKLGIEDHLRVVLQSKKGTIPYYASTECRILADYVDKVYSFLSLLIGENPYLYGLQGEVGHHTVHLRVMRDIIDRSRHGGMDSLRVLFPRQIISILNIRDVFAKFMDIYDRVQQGVNYLVGFNIRSQLYAQYTLPEAIYNFEGVDSELHEDGRKKPSTCLLGNANKEILDGILAKCNAKEKTFLNARFKRKTISLKERFSRVLDELRIVFPYVAGREEGILTALVSARNRYSHYGRGDCSDQYLYVALVHFVNYITVGLVLYKSGFPKEIIAACLNKVEGDYLGIKYNFERCFGVAKDMEKVK